VNPEKSTSANPQIKFIRSVDMPRKVQCVFLNQELEGLEKAPYPGEIGMRIYSSISRQAWQQWLERSVMIINEYQLNSANPEHQDLIERHLLGFLFNEGDGGGTPQGYNPA